MNKSAARLLGFFLSFVLIISCCSFSSFAYKALVSVDNSDWVVADDYIVKSVYPNKVYNDLHDDCYSYGDLDGKTYFRSMNWTDNFPYVTEYTVTFPEFPSSISSAYSGQIVFKNDDSFLLVNLTDAEYCRALLDSHDVLGFYTSIETSVDCYYLSYPYTEWVFAETFDLMDLYTPIHVLINGLADYVSVIWSNTNVYRYIQSDGSVDTVVHSPDNWDLVGTSRTISLTNKISVIAGQVSYTLSAYQLSRLQSGSYCVRIDDIGFIAGTYSTVAQVLGYFGVYDSSGVQVGMFPLFENYSVGFSLADSHDPVDATDRRFLDVVSFPDFDMEITDDSYELKICLLFASNGYNLFFPGLLEIIEFESYEDTMQHNEVIDAIGSASGAVTGAISEASSSLASEIASAASDAASSVNNHMDSIFCADLSDQYVQGDASGVDAAVAHQNQVVSDMMNQLSGQVSEVLPEGFLDDTAYIKSAIDDVDNQYGTAIRFINVLFNTTVDILGVMPFMLFCLAFGFCIYLLGRKLS